MSSKCNETLSELQANVFVHYKPLDHEENNRRDREPKEADSKGRSSLLSLQAMKERYLKIGVGYLCFAHHILCWTD